MVQEVELWTNRISLLLSDHLEISNILGNSNDLIHTYINSHINTYIHKYTYMHKYIRHGPGLEKYIDF